MRRRYLTKLQIGTRGDVGVAASKLLRQCRHTTPLRCTEDAIGNTQPAHEGVLRRRYIEQAMELHPEHFRALGKTPLGRPALHVVPQIKRIALTLELLLRHQLAASGQHPRLCRTLQGQHFIGSVDDGTRRRQIAWRQPSRTTGTAGGKALQELRLLVAKRRIRVNRGQGIVLGCRHRVQPGPGSSSEFQ